MWKLIFNSTTNRGVSANREPLIGEFAVSLPPNQCAWFMSEPNKYMWTGSELVEYPEWNAEQAAAKREADQKLMRDAIKGKAEQKNGRKIEHPNITGAFFEPSAKIDRIISRCDDLAKTDPLPTNSGCFDDINENPVPMTVGQLKKLRNAIIDREEANYAAMKAHITAMKATTSPLTYDYSGGWA